MKRLVAILMGVLMISSTLVGCSLVGKANGKDKLSYLRDMKKSEYSLEYKVYDAQEVSYLKVSGLTEDVKDSNKVSCNVAYKISEGAQYSEITDFVIYNNDIYVNAKKLLNWMSTNEYLSYYASAISIDKDYVLINEEYMNKTFNTLEADVENTAYNTKLNIYNSVLDILTKSYTGDVSVNKGVYSVTLEGDEAIEYINNLTNVINNDDGGTILNDGVTDKINGGVVNALTDIKDTGDVKFHWEYSVTGKKGKRLLNSVYSLVTGERGIQVTVSVNENIGKKKILVPSNCITVEEVVKKMFGDNLGIQ